MAKYFDSSDDTWNDIPVSPFYVLSNDSFFSNWRNTETSGKINTCVVPCDTVSEAELLKMHEAIYDGKTEISVSQWSIEE